MKIPLASIALLVMLSPAPRALGYCWEVGLRIEDCDPAPVRIYRVSDGYVYTGSSRNGCTYETGQPINFRINLNGPCPTSEVTLTPGTKYLIEVDHGGQGFSKSFFTPTGCPNSTDCDSTFNVEPDALWRTSGTLYEFVDHPNAQLLSGSLQVTGAQRVGKRTTYYLQAAANVASSFAWSGVAAVLSGVSTNPNNAYVNVWDGSPQTVTVTITSDWTRERETVTRTIQLGEPD